jgi:hypothetical protein
MMIMINCLRTCMWFKFFTRDTRCWKWRAPTRSTSNLTMQKFLTQSSYIVKMSVGKERQPFFTLKWKGMRNENCFKQVDLAFLSLYPSKSVRLFLKNSSSTWIKPMTVCFFSRFHKRALFRHMSRS